jgi:hypothetical protein
MRVILFQNRFAEPVRSGAKIQTIRGKARCKAGDMLSLRRWTGKPYRSKQEILREASCRAVYQVKIVKQAIMFDGVIYDKPQTLQSFAVLDGFNSWPEMVNWFSETHGLPFHGELITWGA